MQAAYKDSEFIGRLPLLPPKANTFFVKHHQVGGGGGGVYI
jgi:hypothetical protein